MAGPFPSRAGDDTPNQTPWAGQALRDSTDRCVNPLGETQLEQNCAQPLNTPGSQSEVGFDMQNPGSQHRGREYGLLPSIAAPFVLT